MMKNIKIKIMKNLILTIITLFAFIVAIAQPQAINYQALAKNDDGTPIANQLIGIKISIICSGNIVYVESHTEFTNDIGLYSLQIGNGNATTGNFPDIDWSNIDKLVDIEIDPSGGDDYVSVGSFPFLSVPYALYAETAGGGSGGLSCWDLNANGIEDVEEDINNDGIFNALDCQGATGPAGPKGLPGPEGPTGECDCPPLLRIIKNTKGQQYINVEANDENFSIWNFSNEGDMYYQAGNVGIGTKTPEEKLHVDGNICYTGTSAACSDERYKKDITQITGALESLMNIKGVKFNWKTEEYKDKNFTDALQIGVIAQEIESYYPELVLTNNDGYKSVDYPKLTAVLIEAIKEQQEQYQNLEQRIKQIEDNFVTNKEQKVSSKN